MPEITFATCSFYEFRPEMGIPVRSSNGYPRFALKYPLFHALEETFPRRSWMRLPYREFAPKYYEMCDALGTDFYRREAEQIRFSESHNRRDERCKDMPVVLLCFERWNDPKKQPEFCHRSLFASWWNERTGEPVPEFGAAPKAEIRADEQRPLF